LNSQGQHKDFKKLVNVTLYINLAICSLPLLLLLLFSTPILSLYGKDFMNAGTTLQLLTLSTIPNIINIVYGQVLISLGQLWKRTLFDVMLSAAIVASSIYYIPKHLDGGLALSYLIAYSATAFFMVIYYHRKLERIVNPAMISRRNEIPL
jgi:O-antigen/teichoic acid export membrane protein